MPTRFEGRVPEPDFQNCDVWHKKGFMCKIYAQKHSNWDNFNGD